MAIKNANNPLAINPLAIYAVEIEGYDPAAVVDENIPAVDRQEATASALYYGQPFPNVVDFQLDRDYTTPSDKMSFTLYYDNTRLMDNLITHIPNQKIQVSSYGVIIFTGYVDSIKTSFSSSGSEIVIEARDVLGRVVSSNTDPNRAYKLNTPLSTVLLERLATYNIYKIEHSELGNVNALTGTKKVRYAKESTQKYVENIFITKEKKNDVTYIMKNVLELYKVISEKGNIVIRPDLKELSISDMQPQYGEGEYEYLDRILKRNNLTLKALANGQGVYIDQPDYNTYYKDYKITRLGAENWNLDGLLSPKRLKDNNVISGDFEINQSEQPSLIIIEGKSNKSKSRKNNLKVIAINELNSCFSLDGKDIYVKNEIALKINEYKQYNVLDIRKELYNVGQTFSSYNSKGTICFIYMKDEECVNQEQLNKKAYQELAKYQQKFYKLKYKVAGWFADNKHKMLWNTNSIVSVNDDQLGLFSGPGNEEQASAPPFWIKSLSFKMDRKGGMTTDLEIIPAYTYMIDKLDPLLDTTPAKKEDNSLTLMPVTIIRDFNEPLTEEVINKKQLRPELLRHEKPKPSSGPEEHKPKPIQNDNSEKIKQLEGKIAKINESLDNILYAESLVHKQITNGQEGKPYFYKKIKDAAKTSELLIQSNKLAEQKNKLIIEKYNVQNEINQLNRFQPEK